MDDEIEYDDDVEPDEVEARPLTKLDLIIAVWALFGTFAESIAMFFNHVCTLLVAHRNYKTGQQDFAEAIRADLESIPTTEEV